MEMEKPLLKNILALGDNSTWAGSLSVIDRSVAGLLSSDFAERLKEIKRIYFTGCGTSLYAGQVGKYAMEHIAGIPSEAIPAHTLSHYYASDMLGKEVLVAGISATGTSDTVSEALKRSSAAGGLSLAITSNPDSNLAKAANAVVLSGNFDDRTVVKSKSYIYSLLTMYSLAAGIGKLNGKCGSEKAEKLRSRLGMAGARAEEFVSSQSDVLDRLAEKYHGAAKIFIIGAGPNLGTMEEAALKVVEMSRIYAECQELEDFMHGRFRVSDRINPFFILAPHGRSDERILDFLCTTHHIGCPTVVLTDRPTPELKTLATELVRMPEGLEEDLSPLLYILPFYLLGYRMGILKGHDPASRRYEDIIPQETYYRDYKEKLGGKV